MYEGRCRRTNRPPQQYVLEFDLASRKCNVIPLRTARMMPKLKSRVKRHPTSSNSKAETSLHLISAFGSSKAKRNMQQRLDTINPSAKQLTSQETRLIEERHSESALNASTGDLFSTSLVENYYLPTNESAVDISSVVEYEQSNSQCMHTHHSLL